MDTIEPPEIFKVPQKIHKCSCGKKKVIPRNGNSYEEQVLDAAFSHGSHLAALNSLKFFGNVADFKVLSILLDQAFQSYPSNPFFIYNKVVPVPKFLPLLESFCKGFLRLHPPCEYHTYSHYLQVFEDGKFTSLLSEMYNQLVNIAEGVLPDSCVREKVLRKSLWNFSPDCAGLLEKIRLAEAKNSRAYCDLPPKERLTYLFTALEVFVNILEKDLEVWNLYRSASTSPTKFYRPLIVELLWKDITYFDADTILNSLVDKIFNLYNKCVHAQISIKQTKVVGRLISLIAEVVDIIGRHQEAKPDEGHFLAANFKNLHYQPKLENGFRGFALKEIENGRRKISKPPMYHMDETTAIGSICKRFGDALATALNRCSCKYVKKCEVLDKAVLFIKPPWLRFLTTSKLCKQDIRIPLLKTMAREALTDGGDLVTQMPRLRLILLTSTLDTLRMLGYNKTGKKIQRVSKRIKLDPEAYSSEDVEELIVLIRSLTIEIR